MHLIDDPYDPYYTTLPVWNPDNSTEVNRCDATYLCLPPLTKNGKAAVAVVVILVGLCTTFLIVRFLRKRVSLPPVCGGRTETTVHTTA